MSATVTTVLKVSEAAERAVAEQAAINAIARREAECRMGGWKTCQEQEEFLATSLEQALAWEAAYAMGEEEWDEWEEGEEEGWEYVSNQHGRTGGEATHIAPSVLYQPLGEGPEATQEGRLEPSLLYKPLRATAEGRDESGGYGTPWCGRDGTAETLRDVACEDPVSLHIHRGRVRIVAAICAACLGISGLDTDKVERSNEEVTAEQLNSYQVRQGGFQGVKGLNALQKDEEFH